VRIPLRLVAGGGDQNHVMGHATRAVMKREPNLLGALGQHFDVVAACGSDERAQEQSRATGAALAAA
jgi:hypothetical protein